MCLEYLTILLKLKLMNGHGELYNRTVQREAILRLVPSSYLFDLNFKVFFILSKHLMKTI